MLACICWSVHNNITTLQILICDSLQKDFSYPSWLFDSRFSLSMIEAFFLISSLQHFQEISRLLEPYPSLEKLLFFTIFSAWSSRVFLSRYFLLRTSDPAHSLVFCTFWYQRWYYLLSSRPISEIYIFTDSRPSHSFSCIPLSSLLHPNITIPVPLSSSSSTLWSS